MMIDQSPPLESNAVAAQALPAHIQWSTRSRPDVVRTALASPALLDEQLYLAAPARVPHRYPRQVNIQGLYYFESTGGHVWHESSLEGTTLRWMDMNQNIVAIAAQPLTMIFADGTRHVPDYLAMDANHRQSIIYVKPRKLVDKHLNQLANTKAVCDAIGWQLELRHELPEQVAINMRWVAGFKHPGYAPGPDALTRLAKAATTSMTIRESAEALGLHDLAHGRAGIYHLVWAGVLQLDLTQPLADSSTIEWSNR